MYERELIIRKKLEELSEENYKLFSQKIIPNCDNIIGVRIPIIRKLALEIIKDKPLEFLKYSHNEIYYEEVMLKCIIIGNLKEDIYIILEQIEIILPKITNWSLCDTLCCELKIVKKYKEILWDKLNDYIKTNKPYYIRFSIVIMLNYYINNKYLTKLFNIFELVDNQDYYVRMAIAWAVSKCYTEFRNETINYLKNSTLDNFTYNKSLQKITESLKVSKEEKEYIKSMKR